LSFGDGSLVRAALDALVAVLRHFASPTGARGSVLMMMGGLVVLGFLFLAFVFRSAIVGDLAPLSASGRAPLPRARLPGESLRASEGGPAKRGGKLHSFRDARTAARRSSAATVDAVMEALVDDGDDARILESDATRKRVRLYACASCDEERPDCDRERGLLAGGFESLTGQLAKVEEVACRRRGDPHCEFEVRHQVMVRARHRR
jgi:hypothetical protein